jgi:Mrp family chromosome partitioning ATPase
LDGTAGGLRVVTGKPGVGKSALLGVLVCAAHPVLRERYPELWRFLPHTPAGNPRLAVVHARQLSTGQIAEALARQMGASEQNWPEGGWSPQALLRLASVGGHHRPFTLIVDALDEAQRPGELAEELLVPLLYGDVTDNERWPVRMLIGTRRDERVTVLLERAASAQGGLVDLDLVDPFQLHKALTEYMTTLLADDPWYGSVDDDVPLVGVVAGV